MQYKRPQYSSGKANAATINTVCKNCFHIALIQSLELVSGNRDIYNNAFQNSPGIYLHSLHLK